MSDRIDEHGAQAFGVMGFSKKLPDGLVKTYKQLRFCKDRIQPGRMSPEMLATCVVISGNVGVLNKLMEFKKEVQEEVPVEEVPNDPTPKKVPKHDPEIGDDVLLSIDGENVLAVMVEGEVPEGHIAVVRDDDELGKIMAVPLSLVTLSE